MKSCTIDLKKTNPGMHRLIFKNRVLNFEHYFGLIYCWL